jgi:hypothetical protein
VLELKGQWSLPSQFRWDKPLSSRAADDSSKLNEGAVPEDLIWEEWHNNVESAKNPPTVTPYPIATALRIARS